MMQWIKEHWTLLVAILVCIAFTFYCYACESKVRSLTNRNHLINRQELQLELDQIIGTAQLRMLSLDRQDALRTVILENALILVQGQPLNPFGLITMIAAIYGVKQGGCNITKVIRNKRKVNNGTG